MGMEKEKSSPVAELIRGRQTQDENPFLLLGCITDMDVWIHSSLFP